MAETYTRILTHADVENFRAASNHLHDSIITGVNYRNDGISKADHGMCFDTENTTLTLQLLITSIPGHPTCEIVFRDLLEWQMQDAQSDITDFTMEFLPSGFILWAGDRGNDLNKLKKGCYAISESVEYRII